MVAVRAVTYPSQMAGPSFNLGACAFSMRHLRPTQMFSIWSATKVVKASLYLRGSGANALEFIAPSENKTLHDDA